MTQNATLYTTIEELLTLQELASITDGSDPQPSIDETDDGAIRVVWPDVSITLKPLAKEKVEEHLQGFAGFLIAMAGGDEVILTVDGGAGSDLLVGNKSPSLLVGGDGDDTLALGNLDDTVDGGDGVDEVKAEVGGTWHLLPTGFSKSGSVSSQKLISIEMASITGSTGTDEIDASQFNGPVTIDGGDGNDQIIGSDHDDSIFGGHGNDTITGGRGNDTLEGYGGEMDVVHESSDADFFVTETDEFLETKYADGSKDVDKIWNVEQLRITGGPSPNKINLEHFGERKRRDKIFKQSPNQGGAIIDSGDGNDTVVGTGSNDTILGGKGKDELRGLNGEDWIDGGIGDDYLVGGAHVDTIADDQGSNLVHGGDDAAYLRLKLPASGKLTVSSTVLEFSDPTLKRTDTLEDIRSVQLIADTLDDMKQSKLKIVREDEIELTLTVKQTNKTYTFDADHPDQWRID